MKNYPKAPTGFNSQLTEPSSLYKKEVVKSISAIVFFIALYILLIIVAVLLAYFCIKIGLGILTVASGLIVFIAAGGVILIGVFTLFFVFKFLFSNTQTDKSQLFEVTENDQPYLFEFITKITQETQAPFPKKIFLSNEVNASVFYDSSFFSMFLPVKKNLLIGLGLVNSVTISEFKAILAHEFGHFSQKSMKVGSYVYNANRIIHNLLYDNGSFYNTLNRIAGVHFILYVCMLLVSGVVKSIQFILNKTYLFINKQNLKLSREMEFHADSVAASVAGSHALISSLYRLELSEISFSRVLSVCTELIDEKKQEVNIYPAHMQIMNDIASLNKIEILHNLPVVNKNTFSDFDTTRINITNQWASHPSTSDRETKLLNINLSSEIITNSAWEIFINPIELQKQMSINLYQHVVDKDLFSVGTYVEKTYFDKKQFFELPPITNGYWDAKQLPKIEFDNAKTPTQEVYDSESLQLAKLQSGMASDITTLQSIIAKDVVVSSFDFMGQKYETKFASTILETIQNEKINLENQISENDKNILQFHFHKALLQNKKEEFIQTYNEIMIDQKNQIDFDKEYDKIMNEFSPLFQGQQISVEQARLMVSNAQNSEINLKKLINNLMENHEKANQLSETTFAKTKLFLESNRIYFIEETFQSDNIHALFNDLQVISTALQEWNIVNKKKLFSY